MERNLSFDTEGLEKIAVHLGWAQLEMFAWKCLQMKWTRFK